MFRFFVTSDTNIETGVANARHDFMTTEFYKFIENQNYGESLAGLVIVFMCRSPELIFKRRLRFSKKDKILSMDIMLDYNLFVNISPDERVIELCKALLLALPEVLKKYKFKDFDSDKLMTNLESWFVNHNFI